MRGLSRLGDRMHVAHTGWAGFVVLWVWCSVFEGLCTHDCSPFPASLSGWLWTHTQWDDEDFFLLFSTSGRDPWETEESKILYIMHQGVTRLQSFSSCVFIVIICVAYVYVYRCVWWCVCVYTCPCLCMWRPELVSGSVLYFSLCLRQNCSLSLDLAVPVGLSGWQAQDMPVTLDPPPPPVLGLEVTTIPSFSVVSGNPHYVLKLMQQEFYPPSLFSSPSFLFQFYYFSQTSREWVVHTISCSTWSTTSVQSF